ncbi:spore gernimation protein GerD [Halobacillus halophilus]|uniref:Spore germination protein n=1 Tax=Halobacillus halophilus (strain ATCC 35676 / DSM 2266 / JCM 20832 / KCTC 3685 / LMG 17431 / NBRC 102448 / NCIMB 2269) TaxID=866895 RepID=I0JHD3_HALH3|nr:spore germination lipoprotein GerD [Halobacillus halophilus]ASF37774.1 spore gernimation protein GerD [Halobacillus halophilus]CCG43551.1 spore germination protein [Halobacillus halophilus DSM 2266]
MSKIRFLCPVIILVFLAACNGSSGASQQADYDTTKKMIVDILKTDEGKEALTEVLSDEKMQQSMTLESEVVAQSVSDTLVSDKGKEFWSKLFADPSFVQGFSKTLEEQEKDLLKGLMKDPEYQKLLIEIYKNPEMMEQMVTVMQGQKFREHLEKTIQETLNSPVVQAKMSETMLKAAEKMKTGEGSSSSGGEDQQGGSGEQSGSGGQEQGSGSSQ